MTRHGSKHTHGVINKNIKPRSRAFHTGNHDECRERRNLWPNLSILQLYVDVFIGQTSHQIYKSFNNMNVHALFNHHARMFKIVTQTRWAPWSSKLEWTSNPLNTNCTPNLLTWPHLCFCSGMNTNTHRHTPKSTSEGGLPLDWDVQWAHLSVMLRFAQAIVNM